MSMYTYDAASGGLTVQQTISSLPPGDTAGGAAARLRIHPSGAWVLCANWGHDSLAVFAVDGVSGRIEFRGCTAVDGTDLDEGFLSFCLPQFSFIWKIHIRWPYSSAEKQCALVKQAAGGGRRAGVRRAGERGRGGAGAERARRLLRDGRA